MHVYPKSQLDGDRIAVPGGVFLYLSFSPGEHTCHLAISETKHNGGDYKELGLLTDFSKMGTAGPLLSGGSMLS